EEPASASPHTQARRFSCRESSPDKADRPRIEDERRSHSNNSADSPIVATVHPPRKSFDTDELEESLPAQLSARSDLYLKDGKLPTAMRAKCKIEANHRSTRQFALVGTLSSGGEAANNNR